MAYGVFILIPLATTSAHGEACSMFDVWETVNLLCKPMRQCGLSHPDTRLTRPHVTHPLDEMLDKLMEQYLE